MIEEAAGTRMYESKRASAQRTIEKKDSKLKEIEVVKSQTPSNLLDRCAHDRLSLLDS